MLVNWATRMTMRRCGAPQPIAGSRQRSAALSVAKGGVLSRIRIGVAAIVDSALRRGEVATMVKSAAQAGIIHTWVPA